MVTVTVTTSWRLTGNVASVGEKETPGGLVLIEELINTVDLESGEDRLAGADGLAALADRAGVALTAADRAGVVALREGLREACLAHTGPAMREGSAEALTEAFAGAPLALRVDGATGGVALVLAPGLRGAAALAARVAALVAVAEADGTWRRLKVCEADTCRWAYYDHSPAGRRRWCSMRVCGSRAKMRTYRDRARRRQG
ncbi:CGNR zinc finger domain-containing protein [Streptomyces radicis]|uniref:CGNR zinc finger domain-containing protein n=1 Tax=Streptomyces radicis TaxID=1750517 RepID=A0A3A9W6A9_9ACTN|nr:CGNR zinc finger domain-containing protein [Streptomyces radicis]RKN21893.1 CGNR zinc finger domain-containing protein [Streptomyces radicis]